MTFPDHFSSVAGRYARFRPSYPVELFADLAARAPTLDRAWDCGTGNGQAARGLAMHFERVVATDASVSQLVEATRDPETHRVARVAGVAERAPLADHSIALTAVAQALHWFDLETFYGEVRRVVRPGGVLAVWSYALCRVESGVDRVLDRLYHDVLGPHWAPERRHVEAGYRTLPFPFDERPAPSGLVIRSALGRGALAGYVGTWSAVRAARRAGTDPMPAFLADLEHAWPDGERWLEARWPLSVRVGHVV